MLYVMRFFRLSRKRAPTDVTVRLSRYFGTEVTRKNFETIFPQFLKHLSEAEVVSFDTEFTGIHDGVAGSEMDSPDVRYQRILHTSMCYMVTQLGVCLWRHRPLPNLSFVREQNPQHICHIYNFFIFPHSREKFGHEPVSFFVQSTTIDFLKQAQFDFNKVFYEGISFARRSDLTYKQSLIEKRLQLPGNIATPSVPLPENKESLLAQVEAEVREFIQRCIHSQSDPLPNSAPQELRLSSELSAFDRKMIYEHLLSRLEEKWRPVVRLKTEPVTLEDGTRDNSKFQLTVRFLGVGGSDTLLAEMRNVYEEEKRNMEELIGVARVLEAIQARASKVTLVGHNCLLDLMHMIHHLHTPLPSIYQEFKLLCTSIFGSQIYDTKHLAISCPALQSVCEKSRLQDLVECIETGSLPKPEIEFPDQSEEVTTLLTSHTKYHNAAYDALQTGRCFFAMTEFLANASTNSSAIPSPLQSYANKIHMHASHLYKFMSLDVPEPTNDAALERIFLCKFPESWKHFQLFSLFKKFTPAPSPDDNSMNGPVELFRVDGSSAWVRCPSTWSLNTVEQVLQSVRSASDAQVVLVPYSKVKRVPPFMKPKLAVVEDPNERT